MSSTNEMILNRIVTSMIGSNPMKDDQCLECIIQSSSFFTDMSVLLNRAKASPPNEKSRIFSIITKIFLNVDDDKDSDLLANVLYDFLCIFTGFDLYEDYVLFLEMLDQYSEIGKERYTFSDNNCFKPLYLVYFPENISNNDTVKYIFSSDIYKSPIFLLAVSLILPSVNENSIIERLVEGIRSSKNEIDQFLDASDWECNMTLKFLYSLVDKVDRNEKLNIGFLYHRIFTDWTLNKNDTVLNNVYDILHLMPTSSDHPDFSSIKQVSIVSFGFGKVVKSFESDHAQNFAAFIESRKGEKMVYDVALSLDNDSYVIFIIGVKCDLFRTSKKILESAMKYSPKVVFSGIEYIINQRYLTNEISESIIDGFLNSLIRISKTDPDYRVPRLLMDAFLVYHEKYYVRFVESMKNISSDIIICDICSFLYQKGKDLTLGEPLFILAVVSRIFIYNEPNRTINYDIMKRFLSKCFNVETPLESNDILSIVGCFLNNENENDFIVHCKTLLETLNDNRYVCILSSIRSVSDIILDTIYNRIFSIEFVIKNTWIFLRAFEVFANTNCSRAMKTLLSFINMIGKSNNIFSIFEKDLDERFVRILIQLLYSLNVPFKSEDKSNICTILMKILPKHPPFSLASIFSPLLLKVLPDADQNIVEQLSKKLLNLDVFCMIHPYLLQKVKKNSISTLSVFKGLFGFLVNNNDDSIIVDDYCSDLYKKLASITDNIEVINSLIESMNLYLPNPNIIRCLVYTHSFIEFYNNLSLKIPTNIEKSMVLLAPLLLSDDNDLRSAAFNVVLTLFRIKYQYYESNILSSKCQMLNEVYNNIFKKINADRIPIVIGFFGCIDVLPSAIIFNSIANSFHSDICSIKGTGKLLSVSFYDNPMAYVYLKKSFKCIQEKDSSEFVEFLNSNRNSSFVTQLLEELISDGTFLGTYMIFLSSMKEFSKKTFYMISDIKTRLSPEMILLTILWISVSFYFNNDSLINDIQLLFYNLTSYSKLNKINISSPQSFNLTMSSIIRFVLTLDESVFNSIVRILNKAIKSKPDNEMSNFIYLSIISHLLVEIRDENLDLVGELPNHFVSIIEKTNSSIVSIPLAIINNQTVLDCFGKYRINIVNVCLNALLNTECHFREDIVEIIYTLTLNNELKPNSNLVSTAFTVSFSESKKDVHYLELSSYFLKKKLISLKEGQLLSFSNIFIEYIHSKDQTLSELYVEIMSHNSMQPEKSFAKYIIEKELNVSEVYSRVFNGLSVENLTENKLMNLNTLALNTRNDLVYADSFIRSYLDIIFCLIDDINHPLHNNAIDNLKKLNK